ncbi:MAG TPA: glycoside hydrolase family 9, partial [Candidatus Paceibacterota bacterium]|nr:glycoside hydrolase family 9 [Candidatus Paceibacterota bacterium]
DPRLLELCENEIISAGEDQLRRSEDSAYGVSFPSETKRTRSAGWFFAGDAAFDLAVASQLDYPIMNDPQPKLLAAILSNLNFESGCNPVNVSYLTGLGWKREREIVHQYALNDRRVLPPSGIPIGNIQDGFGWLDNYGEELGALTFPPDDDDFAPYPFYDRWGDSFNLKTEFVIPNQAHALGYLAWLMAKTPLKDQKWKASPAQINGVAATVLANQRITATLTASGLDLSRARTVWEFNGEEPVFGAAFQFTPAKTGRAWLEAEAQLPDGRRVYGVVDFNVR